eukprot:Nk52_evm28s805 gene=Nk52_evmTU28s805
MGGMCSKEEEMPVQRHSVSVKKHHNKQAFGRNESGEKLVFDKERGSVVTQDVAKHDKKLERQIGKAKKKEIEEEKVDEGTKMQWDSQRGSIVPVPILPVKN